MEIKEVLLKEEKQRITREILEALPDWFGIEESREDYIKKLKMMMDDSDLLEKLSINSKKYNDNFKIKNIVKDWLNIFK